MISKTRICICILLVFLIFGEAQASVSFDFVKSPINYVKKLMRVKKDNKDKETKKDSHKEPEKPSLSFVKSPVSYVKELMGLKKENKGRAKKTIPAKEPVNADDKHNHFVMGYDLFSEGNYYDAAVELYAFVSASSPDEEDYEWAQFFFGISLNRMKYSHAAVDVLGNLVTRKPNPKIVSYCFELIEKNISTMPHDEEFIVSQVVGDQDYGFVEGDIADFVNYLQGVYDWEHKFFEWGDDHFKKVRPTSKYYFDYLYKQALYSVYKDNIDEAIEYLDSILKSEYPSADLKDESRKTLARLLYEKGEYDDADMIYSGIQKNIIEQAENILERAWVHYREGHSEKAMGLLYSFQAPSFQNAFRPEYFILKSFIFKDVCNYQNALAVVNEFKARYGDAIAKLYERSLPQDNNDLMQVLLNKKTILKTYNFLILLEKEMEACSSFSDDALREYLTKLYGLQIEESREILRKQITVGYEEIANDLLKYEEDAYLMEYEIGLDMYQRVYQAHYTDEKTTNEKVAKGLALYEFQGEFWNDELAAYEVKLQNKCENMEEWDVFFK